MLSTLDKILTFIQDNIADAVTIVETENSVTLTPYRELKKYTAKGRQYPSITILPDETDPMIESAGNRAFFGNPTKRDDVLIVQVWDRGNTNDADTVETNVIGYMDALNELFQGDYNIAGVKGIQILGTRYTELFPDLTVGAEVGGLTPLLKGASLQIRVTYNIL